MAFGSMDHDDDVMNEINMTPLVDVMLVLLIVFIITVPVIHHSFKLELPEESNVEQQLKPDTIQIAVQADGQYLWNEEAVSDNTLAERLETAAFQQPQPEIHISGDKNVRYERVIHLMSLAQKASLTKIGFVTTPEQ